MRPSEIAKDFAPASNQCKDCIYFPKCDEYPFDESGCKDFKDRSRFVELPCKIGDKVWIIGFFGGCVELKIVKVYYAAYYNDVSLSYIAYKKDEKISTYRAYGFSAAEIGKAVFLSREEAEKALAERGKQ